MYNRYIRNDQGGYTRVPEPEETGQNPSGRREAPPEHRSAPSPSSSDSERSSRENGPSASGRDPPPPHRQPERPAYENADGPGNGGLSDGLSGFLRHMLDQFHLDSVDTGDLLLLGLLFFLFREDADEELLIALGLLLIL